MAKHLVTSALPYINGIKHLGNLVGSLLPADVYARFLRTQEHEVLFICGTDEHGTPAELSALEAKLSPRDYCDKYYEIQKGLYEQFNISTDYFGRTSSQQNVELTQHFAKQLMDNGFLETRTVKQAYSEDEKRFLPDRYVEGTCPHCGYDKARGDQCDGCTRLLNPEELINPHSTVTKSSNIIFKESKHLFLKLEGVTDELNNWIASKEKDWPKLVTSIAKKWINEGLQERCITRDLEWGVPVPFEGFEDKVFYVWFDAPIGYISITKEWADLDPTTRNYKDWWFDAKDVNYTEFMGKDNVSFHTIFFPATLMASGEPWKLVDYLKGFSWMNYNGGKFSTSQKRGIFMDQALEDYEADYWRYYLLANAPESDDYNFTIDGFASAVNKDLNDVLGNFANRVLKMSQKTFANDIPQGGELTQVEKDLGTTLDEKIKAYTKHLGDMSIKKAVNELRAIWAEGNNYIAQTEPWKVVKEDKDRAATILRTAINLIRIFGILAGPIIPQSAEKLLNQINIEYKENVWINDIAKDITLLEKGTFNDPAPIFAKISDEDIERLTEKYKGAK